MLRDRIVVQNTPSNLIGSDSEEPTTLTHSTLTPTLTRSTVYGLAKRASAGRAAFRRALLIHAGRLRVFAWAAFRRFEGAYVVQLFLPLLPRLPQPALTPPSTKRITAVPRKPVL